MLRRCFIAGALIASGLLGVLAAVGEGPVRAAATCRPAATSRNLAAPANNEAIYAAAGRSRLVLVGAGASVASRPVESLSGVVRHVATSRFGVAYVRDRKGGDVVVIVRPDGTRQVHESAEAVHPSWSPAGDVVWAVGDRLRLLRAGAEKPRTLGGPEPGGDLFSPIFPTRDGVVVVRSAPPTRLVPEDERGNDLWWLDRPTGRWHRLSTLTHGTNRWAAIRTPVAVGDGSFEFVRVTAVASKTDAPTFELWRGTSEGVRFVRRLPGERYLAAHTSSARVWNIPDHGRAVWRLVREDSGGRLVDIGCGSVMVDPMAGVDPDRTTGRREAPLAHSPHKAHTAAPAGADSASLAILVGDFDSLAGANAAADQMRAAYGYGAVQVISASHAPTVLRPGVYAAILRLPHEGTPEKALAAFRAALPQYGETSWLVSP